MNSVSHTDTKMLGASDFIALAAATISYFAVLQAKRTKTDRR